MSSRREAELRRRTTQQAVVATFSRSVLEADDTTELLEAAASAVRTAVPADRCVVFECLPGRERAVRRRAEGWDEPPVPTVVDAASDASLVGAVSGRDDPVVVDDLRTDGRFVDAERLLERGVRSSLCVGVAVDGRPWGALVAHASLPSAFDSGDATTLRTIATVLAGGLERACSGADSIDDRRILEASPVGIVVVDDAGTVRFGNERAAALLGCDREALVARSLADDRWERVDADRASLPADAPPFAAIAAAGSAVSDVEYDRRRPDGERRRLAIEATPLSGDGPGTSLAVVTLRDVTGTRRLEAEFEEILGRVTDAFYALDDEFRFIHANERAAELLDRPVRELLGRTVWELFPGTRETRGYAELHRALETQSPRSYEETFPTLERRFEVRVYPSSTGLSVYFRDVTDRTERERALERANERLGRSNEQLERSNERLEHFAYAASHDLQEPLRMVSSYLRLLEGRYGDRLDDDGREFLAYAVDGADRMREMIEALLAYSRVETRGDPLEPVALHDVLANVCAELQGRFAGTDATITVAELPRVEGDAEQLRQLFRHLLDNAVTYSGEGVPRIDVSAERNGGSWRVSVRDRGIGIPQERTEDIFEVFERLHTVDEHAGTGIGLALCQRIVERHGGEIWVDSVPGEGSTFYLTLPAAGDGERS